MDDSEALAAYLEDVRQYPALEPGEAAALLAEARAGDEAARKSLIEGLLAEVAEKLLALAPRGISAISAIQEGNLVLMQLVEDPKVNDPMSALPEAARAHFSRLRSDEQ